MQKKMLPNILISESLILSVNLSPIGESKTKKPCLSKDKQGFLYSGRDLNPHVFKGHRILSPACLPIPPPEQKNNKIKKLQALTYNFLFLERKTRLELATSTLARLRSTN